MAARYSILDTRYWILDTGYSILDTWYWILDGCDGSFVNLDKMDNLSKLLSYNLDPRLRHSGTSLAGPIGRAGLSQKKSKPL